MKTLRFVTLAVLAAAATQIGVADESRTSERREGRPDAYVAHWDAVGSEAFSASGLTAAEGHVIFAYQENAVRAGDSDGNDATEADPAWSPLLAAPNHPEYPSAHACVVPATGRVIARFLGSRVLSHHFRRSKR